MITLGFQDYNPAAYYHAQQGNYELFMYRSVAYNPTIQVSSTTDAADQQVTLTATVTALNASGQQMPAPSGEISFYIGDPVLLGTAPVVNGVATLKLSISQLSTLTAESTRFPIITANYNNDVAAMPAVLAKTVPTVTVTDASNTYTGNAFIATATVNDGSTLDGAGLTLTYYAGSDASGTGSLTAPRMPAHTPWWRLHRRRRLCVGERGASVHDQPSHADVGRADRAKQRGLHRHERGDGSRRDRNPRRRLGAHNADLLHGNLHTG